MSISVKQQFEIWRKETEEELAKLKQDTDSVVEPFHRDIKMNTIKNIPHDFGKFLYTCLGDRVVGVSNRVINMERINAEGIPALAEEKKCTVEEWLELYDCSENWNGKKVFRERQAFITAGRKFGVSYINGPNKRTHTIYFEDDKIFEYMTQEHVDCVKNSMKRECAAAFLSYRDSFVSDINALNEDNLFEINVPLKIAKVSTLDVTGKYYTDSYSRTHSTAVVIEDVMDDVAQFATISVPTFVKWDKKSNVNSRDARNGATDLPVAISIKFGKAIGKYEKAKKVLVHGNIDIAFERVVHSIDTLENAHSNDTVISLSETDGFPRFGEIINKNQQLDRYTLRNCEQHGTGLPLNICDVINHPVLRAEIQKRVDFFKTKSVELQELKHKFAAMYFLEEG